jgi:hypothetical protein
MAKSKFVSILCSCRDVARIRRARSRRPVSASTGDRCPTCRSGRRPLGGGRIRARETPAADPQSVTQTVAQSAIRRSGRRWFVCGLHAPEPVDPFCDRLQTGHVVEPSSSADSAEISAAVLIEEADEAWPQRSQPGRHRRGRRHETAEPDVGVSTDRAADHAGLRSARR